MSSRRSNIEMTDDEVMAFLEQERTTICATNSPRGWPHLMPLWYFVRDGEVWSWTYAKSQKVRNLERDSRATLQIEAGDAYDQLRGVMLECDVTIHRDPDVVRACGEQLLTRYLDEAEVAVAIQQAPKRVALQFAERRRATWDHRKLSSGVF